LQRAIKHKYDALWDLSADGPPPPFVHDGFWGALYGAKPIARIDKARKLLGYNPAYNLRDGMAQTAEWAMSANPIPPQKQLGSSRFQGRILG
jgi:nucleoside-diphosphate-sugar epimerase